jgi:hypothetical protein
MSGVKDGEVFLSAWKQAVEEYGEEKGIPKKHRAIFQDVSDNLFDFGKTKNVGSSDAPQGEEIEGRSNKFMA